MRHRPGIAVLSVAAIVLALVAPVAGSLAVGSAAAASSAAPVVPAAPDDGPTNAPDGPSADRPGGGPTLVAAYPNPVERGDPGEYVVVDLPAPANTSGWTIADGETEARLPARRLAGTVALATEPDAARPLTDHPVHALDGRLQLADDGEQLSLVVDGEVVDEARYRRAPESAVRDFRAGAWRPVGATELAPVRTGGGEATVFALPDAPGVTADHLRTAEDRLLLGGYTLTSRRVVDALVAARARGAAVHVLLDGAPVAGPTSRQARLLDRLADAGVDVRLLEGPHARYRHHHPKYAVVDDTAVVLTENFKPAGTGGMSSRGWGVVLQDPAAADALAGLHRADREWRAATPWPAYREGRDFADPDPALGSFDPRHPPQRVSVDAATVLVAPDNAEAALVERLESADERILVQQVSIGGRENPLLRAALSAAARGVGVRIHLSDAWYVHEDNAALVDWLNRRAEAEGWDLAASVDEADGYEKIHTKGVVVDDAAVVGSLNWRRSSARENREVLVVLDSPDAAAYYASVFGADRTSAERPPLPAGILGGVAVAVAAALLVARRIEFRGRGTVIEGWRS